MDMPSRKSTRLNNWDYANRACYHVTICTHGSKKILSTIDSETYEVNLTDIGQCVSEAIDQALERYPSVHIENHVIMPNHVHLLIALDEDIVSLTRFIGFMKSQATRRARKKYPNIDLWQRSFHDHILRGEKNFHAAWQYIDENPRKWASDKYYG